MKVNGYEVPNEIEKAGLDAMVGAFSISHVCFALKLAGAPEFIERGPWNVREYCAYRIANRLLERQRKAGKIWYNGKYWEECKLKAGK